MKKKFVVMLSALVLMAVPALSLAAPTVGSNTVNSAAIIDGAVATADIANKAVTAAKIADATITANQLANGAVTAAKLGITCPSGQYLQYNGTTWVCSVGTAGPAGPQGIQGVAGVDGAVGPQGPKGDIAKYANVIIVAKSGGDFTDPMAALDSITDASATNTYLVKIMPGTYEIPGGTGYAINAKSFVDIEGSGKSVTKLRVVNNLTQGGGGTVISAYYVTNSEIRNITLEAETASNSGRTLIGLLISDSSYKAQDIDINIIGDGDNHGVTVNTGGKSFLKNIKIAFSGAATSGTGVLMNGAAVDLEDITVESQANMSNYIAGVYYIGSAPTNGISVRNLKLVGFDFTKIRHFGAYLQSENATIRFYDSILGRVSIHTGSQMLAVNSMIDALNTYTADGLRPIYGKFKGVNCYNSSFDPINLNN